MSVSLDVQLVDPSADEERVDALASQLRRELLEMDVEDVRRRSAGAAPDGTRALELAAVGALIVTMQQSSELLIRVVGAVREWLKRDPEPARTVKLTIGDRTIELSAASSEQQDRLITEFVRAVEPGTGDGQ
jgi:hypothetical protein